MPSKKEFAQQVRQLCASKNIPISTLENAAGYSPGMISRWSSSNEDFIVLTKLVAMANCLNVSVDELLSRRVPSKTSIIEFPGSTDSKLLDLISIQHRTWTLLEDISSLSLTSEDENIISNDKTGRNLADIFSCQLDRLILLLVAYCDDPDDREEGMNFALFYSLGHGIPIQRADIDLKALQHLYTQVLVRAILTNLASTDNNREGGKQESRLKNMA